MALGRPNSATGEPGPTGRRQGNRVAVNCSVEPQHFGAYKSGDLYSSEPADGILGNVDERPYRRRVVDDELDELLESLPAISIEGAKGVGKTRTASQRTGTIFSLDDPGQLAIARGDPTRMVSTQGPLLLDEWQRFPEIWDLVRRAVDKGAPPGKFLLAGSSSPAGLGTHSGAGRIVSLRMRPLALAEREGFSPTVSLKELLSDSKVRIEGQTPVALNEYTREILTSGFPGFRGYQGRALTSQLEGCLNRIVDRDFPELGLETRNPAALRRWMASYAAASSGTASFETIRQAATGKGNPAPARSTVIPYRNVLQRLWILDPLPGWLPTKNRIRRVAQSEKHHLVDPALAAHLLGVDEDALLSGVDVGPRIPRDGTLLGALFESLVAQSVRVYAHASGARTYHLRTREGREVDLIVELPNGRTLALEVKLSRNVEAGDLKHLHWLKEQMGDDLLDAAVITTGTEAYRREDGIAVIPAALLGP
jgi:uncharacterized protein